MNDVRPDFFIQAIFGTEAQRVAANWIIQYQGHQDGLAVCSIVGVLAGELRHPVTREQGFAHEMQSGELVLRPGRRFTDGEKQGAGLTNLITTQASPDCWRYEIRNGVLVPNEHYGRR